jgi:hypothetical protein
MDPPMIVQPNRSAARARGASFEQIANAEKLLIIELARDAHGAD